MAGEVAPSVRPIPGDFREAIRPTARRPKYDQSQAKVRVFTEKEGLLSRVAHDLELEVTEFELSVEETSVSAKFSAYSLRVLHAMKDGQPTSALSAKDKGDIDERIVKEVLEPHRFPSISFASTSVKKETTRATIAGSLTLHGTTRPVTVWARVEAGSWIAEVPINQPDFGIKPYSAMMGTLKVKPMLTVRVTLPAR